MLSNSADAVRDQNPNMAVVSRMTPPRKPVARSKKPPADGKDQSHGDNSCQRSRKPCRRFRNTGKPGKGNDRPIAQEGLIEVYLAIDGGEENSSPSASSRGPPRPTGLQSPTTTSAKGLIRKVLMLRREEWPILHNQPGTISRSARENLL